jgi:hypothetical protein
LDAESAIALVPKVAYSGEVMKTNLRSSAAHAQDSFASGDNSRLSPKLKELQGSFALEGIEISDERMLKYAAEFADAEKRGEIAEEIERAIKEIR